ncbi:MAG TPA: SRPBCC domain-containing protein [Terracidiphilus sp.]|jgi:uncharacterized protein YndB with AHSA1/START domain
MTSHSHRITVEALKQRVYEAITTEHGLRGWYTPSVHGSASHGEHLQLHFKSKAGPFHWKINEIAPGSVVQWECLEGPGASRGTMATFHLSESDGRTIVELDHEGIDEEDAKRKTCNSMWGTLMLHLKRFVETRTADPAFV